MRPGTSPLDRLLAAADDVHELLAIAHAGSVYVRGIYAPNIKEPFYIANRRKDLEELVRGRDVRKRRAAPRKVAA